MTWVEGSQPEGVNVAQPGSWSGGLGAIICSKEFNKSDFDVESRGTALRTHSCPQLTLLKC